MAVMKRFIALLLALTLLLSLVSCGKKTPAVDIVEGDVEQKVEDTIVDKAEDDAEVKAEDPVEEKAPLAAETDRETLEKIADMVGIDDKEDVSSMDDDTLEDYIYSELDKEVADLTPSKDATTGDNPAVDSTGKEEYYEEDGSMNQPFDVIYPELVENGEVEYAEDALLLKISNSQGATLTSGMQSAGVAKLEPVVPMSDYTWYKASLAKGTDISTAVSGLRSLSEVEMVDYDYVVETTAMDEYKELPDNLIGNPKDRWDLHYCGVPDAYGVMENPGGSSSVIVAVIDTGVDYNHEDLKQNIWVNSAETPGNGIDDDGNGYIDDYYGVDVIADYGSGNDDHGHGTHVAGIIAAQNNNLGTVGLAYNCKIMPIKAGNHSGYFLQSNIAEAVYYAAQNGAEIINMSFGGTACSQVVQDALAAAYASNCVLVASAGNDFAPNEPYMLLKPIPNYPAALTYVVGVMAVDSDGVEAGFSNWDVKAFNGVEYEVYAPGVDIVSTIPGNGYATWSGTSMAAPYVSAIAAILRSEYTDRDKYPTRFIYGQICSTSENIPSSLIHQPEQTIVNLYDALTDLPKPNLGVTDYLYFDTVRMAEDTVGKNNGDGVVDAGETIALGLTLRNQWGMSENTVVTIDNLSPAGLPDQFVEIVKGTVNYGSVGTYSNQDCGRIYTNEIITGWENPFYIKIANNCPNDYKVTLNVTITAENGMDEEDNATYTFEDTISFVVRNGVVLPSIIDSDRTLTADNLYIIPSGTLIKEGVTVTAEAGTHIQFYTADANDPYANEYVPKLAVAGAFITEGTEENPVYIYPSDLYAHYVVEMTTSGTGYIQLDGADITNLCQTNMGGDTDAAKLITAKDCTFRANPDIGVGYSDDHKFQYYQKTVGGGVETYYRSLYLSLKSADSCVFYKIPHYRFSYCQFTNCAFVDCGMEFLWFYQEDWAGYLSGIEGCLFLGGYYYEMGDGSIKATEKTYTVSPGGECYVPSAILRCDETNAEYLLVSYKPSPARYYIDEYLSTLGISRAKMETEAEWTELKKNLPNDPWNEGSTSMWYDLGIRFNVLSQMYAWNDGTPVGEWMELQDMTPFQWPYWQAQRGVSPLQQISNVAEEDNMVVIYELPDEVNGEELAWSEETNTVAIMENLRHINAMFHGNAVINRISTETDVTNWFRVQSEQLPGAIISLGGNYWGTTNEQVIELQMVDGLDYGEYAILDYKPYLTEAPELVFPYVTDVAILNKAGEEITHVGGEEITVRVTFSRNMNMMQPLDVAFGSSEPYRDYVVEGDFVNARTWVGTYTVSTVISNGYQYFSIGGGEADNGKDLYTDWARFAFEIDTTAAQAMIMQGEPTAEGINLTWMQDDFDTLMGYNIYRSTALDGQYQRLNSSVIPAETKAFFDDTVEPGQQYFYNFTVVKTDLTESEPSGKITIRSMDTMAPNVYHSPVASATTGSNLVVSATVTDNLQISSVKLMYRTTGTDEYKSATMNKQNDKYVAIIPAANLSTEGLEYYIDAFDGVSHTYKGSAETPYLVTVLEPTTTNDLGDVDGNGVINLLDALMVLKAKNHKLNLDPAQFVRADLDGNETLETWEALRILQYASGTVGSVLG